MTTNNPFASASDPKAAKPNSGGGVYVIEGTHRFKVLDIKLTHSEQSGDQYHVWELERVQSDNENQAQYPSFLCQLVPDKFKFGIRDSKAITSAVIGANFEDMDTDILSSTTTEEGKKMFLGRFVDCIGVKAETRGGNEIVKTRWSAVPDSEQPAAE